MSKIYLISRDRFRESLILNKYATTDEEIIKIALEDFKKFEINPTIVSVEIILDKIKIKYYESWDDTEQFLETKTYYVFSINKI